MRRSATITKLGWRLGTVTLIFGALAVACSADGDALEPDESDQASTTVGSEDLETLVAVPQAEVEDAMGAVDQLLVMEPGGFEPFVVGDEEVIRSRHVLRARTPDGPSDLFEVDLILRPPPGAPEGGFPSGPQRCLAVQSGGGRSMGCSDLASALDEVDERIQQGASSDGTWLILELRGPSDTTHFIVTVGQTRIGVVPVDGYALVTVSAAASCAGGGTVEAFRLLVKSRSERLEAFCG